MNYQYDGGGRLSAEAIAQDPGGRNGTMNYTLDGVGNRLARGSTVPGVASTNATYDANDRPAGDTFDGNGNQLTTAGVSYAYDFENRLKSVNGAGG